MTARPLATTPVENQLRSARWLTSSHSTGGTTCIQVAFLNGVIAMRDSKHPDQSPLLFTEASYKAFIADVRANTPRG